jgi:transcription termination factor Rho
VRVETVNGKDAEPPEERPLFGDLTPVHPTERLAGPAAMDSVPFGKGSRVSIGGPPGAGATRLLRELVAAVGEKSSDIAVSVVLVGTRPEELTEWTRDSGAAVTGGSFDRSGEAQAQAAELAVERAKRVAERGGDALVVVDSLEFLPAGVARRVFGAARNLEGGGSLTVVAATGMAWEPQRQASTRVSLDPPADGAPQVSASRSATLRADLLG